MPPPPPPPSLRQRAWLAYLVQELTSPAAELSCHAEELHATAPTDPHVCKLLDRICDRARYLTDTVRKLAAAEIAPHSDAELKTLRHDLRGAAGYVISACDSLEEEAADLGPLLTATR